MTCPAQGFPVPITRSVRISPPLSLSLFRSCTRAHNEFPTLCESSEPTSSVKPKLPYVRKVEFMEGRSSGAVCLTCPVQGYPVPLSRWDGYLIASGRPREPAVDTISQWSVSNDHRVRPVPLIRISLGPPAFPDSCYCVPRPKSIIGSLANWVLHKFGSLLRLISRARKGNRGKGNFGLNLGKNDWGNPLRASEHLWQLFWEI